MSAEERLRIHDPGPDKRPRNKKQRTKRLEPQHFPLLRKLAEARDNGLTDAELGLSLGMAQDHACKRRSEMQHLGLVEDSGLRRESPRGRLMTVWRATGAGQARAKELEGRSNG